jgi:hypothetical protein
MLATTIRLGVTPNNGPAASLGRARFFHRHSESFYPEVHRGRLATALFKLELNLAGVNPPQPQAGDYPIDLPDRLAATSPTTAQQSPTGAANPPKSVT